MNTAIVYDNNGVSTLDALWSLFISQPKSVRNAFAKRLISQDSNAYAELQRVAVGNSLKKALKELKKQKRADSRIYQTQQHSSIDFAPWKP